MKRARGNARSKAKLADEIRLVVITENMELLLYFTKLVMIDLYSQNKSVRDIDLTNTIDMQRFLRENLSIDDEDIPMRSEVATETLGEMLSPVKRASMFTPALKRYMRRTRPSLLEQRIRQWPNRLNAFYQTLLHETDPEVHADKLEFAQYSAQQLEYIERELLDVPEDDRDAFLERMFADLPPHIDNPTTHFSIV
jgi:hypothetical protein